MVEIKKEFYEVMTLVSAYIYHETLGLDFILADGEVKEVKKEDTKR